MNLISEQSIQLRDSCQKAGKQCFILVDNEFSDGYNVYVNLQSLPDSLVSESDYLRLINNLSEVVFKLSKGNYCIKSSLDIPESIS